MKRVVIIGALVLLASVAAGAALARSSEQPGVGGVMQELGCSPAAKAAASVLSGDECRQLAQAVFGYDKGAAALEQALADMRSNQDAIKDQLDSLTDISEEQSTRLQSMMDQRSTFTAELSNLLKKIADTQDQIAQNLKGSD